MELMSVSFLFFMPFSMGLLAVLLAPAEWTKKLRYKFVLPWIPLVIVFMVVLAVFAAGVSMLLAIANVHFRDTEHFLSLALQLWMYLSPIIYPVSLVQEQSARLGPLLGLPITLEAIYDLNPMVHFVAVFRSLLYDNAWPDPLSAALCIGWAVVALGLGLLVFRRNERDLAEAL